MATYTVKDTKTGKNVTFQWNEAEPPNDSDMAEVFAAAESQQSTTAPPTAPQPQGGWVNDMEAASQGLGGVALKPAVIAAKFLRDHPTLSKMAGTGAGAIAGAPGGPLGMIAGGALGSAGADAYSQIAQTGTEDAPLTSEDAAGRIGISGLEGAASGATGAGTLAGAPRALRMAASPGGQAAIAGASTLYSTGNPLYALSAAAGGGVLGRIDRLVGKAAGSRGVVPEAADSMAKWIERLALRARQMGTAKKALRSTAPMLQSPPLGVPATRLSPSQMMEYQGQLPPAQAPRNLRDVGPMPSAPLPTPPRRVGPVDQMASQGLLPKAPPVAPPQAPPQAPFAAPQVPPTSASPRQIRAFQPQPQVAPKPRVSTGPTPDRVLRINLGAHGPVKVVFPDANHADLFAASGRAARAMRDAGTRGVGFSGRTQAPDMNALANRLGVDKSQIHKLAEDYRAEVMALARFEKAAERGGGKDAEVIAKSVFDTAPPPAEASPELQAGYREALMMEPGLSYGQRTTPQVASPELQSIINDIPGPTLPPPPPPGSIPKGQHTLPNNYQGTGGGPPMKSIGMNSAQETADELMLLNILKSGGKLSRQETISKMKAAGASESAISAVMRNFKGSIQ